MKIASVFLLVALFGTGVVHAQNPAPPSSPSPMGARTGGLGSPSTVKALLSGSHWAWYEGRFDRYEKGMPHWIEFYEDGSARVPWRSHPQLWSVRGNVLTVSDSGIGGDKHIFKMNLRNQSGSAANQNLHIRYEEKASRPVGWK